MVRKKLTFKELYELEGEKPAKTPKQIWVEKICEVTKKKENTVRCWLAGVRNPDDLTKEVIAKYLNAEVESLFPINNGD